MSLDTDFVLETLHNPTREELDRYVCESKPVLIKGLVTQWPAFSLWQDPNYLIEKVGPSTVIPLRTKFSKSRKLTAATTEWFGETANIDFKTFMQHWLQFLEWKDGEESNDDFYYLASLPMNKHFPNLMDDVIVPPHPKEQKKAGNLWIGNKGQITDVHYDYSTGDPGMDGIHGVIKGYKVFTLFDPAKNVGCFPRKHIWGRFHQSIVSKGGLPDPEEFPQYKNARFIRIELRDGDALFIPKLWWHHVHTLEPSIAVNFWFQHLGSERLKLTRHWPFLEEYLNTILHMEITHDKMRNVLQFFGLKPTDEEVEHYRNNPIQFMKLTPFIQQFGNGTKAPWMISEDSKKFAVEIAAKVEEWVNARLQNPDLISNNNNNNSTTEAEQRQSTEPADDSYG